MGWNVGNYGYQFVGLLALVTSCALVFIHKPKLRLFPELEVAYRDLIHIDLHEFNVGT